MIVQTQQTLLIEAATDLEEFAFGPAWEKLKALGKLAKDEFMKGYRRGRGIPEPQPKKDKAKEVPKSAPKAKSKPEPKQATKQRPKPAPAEPKAEPKKEPKPKPGLDKRKSARKARKAKKAPPAPVKDKMPSKADKPATKGKTPAKGKPAKKRKVQVGKAEPAPNAPDKIRVMGKDGKWIYYDKKAYDKIKRGKK